ncbi:MAG: MBOAT family protein [Fimbriimonas sp.]
MLFHTFVFLVFAIVFFGLWPLVRKHTKPRLAFIVLMSLIFYGWAEWWFVLLLLATGAIDFFLALRIEDDPARKRLYLGLSVGMNLGSLATFKYLGFFTENLNWLLHTDIPKLSLALPIGISFYTFQEMSYVIDVYLDRLKPTRSLLHFFAYLAFFPQLVAGPIERASHILPQLLKWNKPTDDQQWQGLRLIIYGLFKKAVIADNLAVVVNGAFDAPTAAHTSIYWWVIVTMFAIQIYCDFSGYSDIARGLAKWVGIELMFNFLHPYNANSFREFWRRWHISLSSWFRDYVYIPLGGSKDGPLQAHRNMWATMLLSGFWHGAAWTFVLWGALHAAYLSIERETNWTGRLQKLPLGSLLASLAVMPFIWIGWLFFRAKSFTDATHILGLMLNPLGHAGYGDVSRIARLPQIILLGCGIAWLVHEAQERGKFAWWSNTSLYERAVLIILIPLIVYARGPGGAFIYFAF